MPPSPPLPVPDIRPPWERPSLVAGYKCVQLAVGYPGGLGNQSGKQPAAQLEHAIAGLQLESRHGGREVTLHAAREVRLDAPGSAGPTDTRMRTKRLRLRLQTKSG